MIEDKDETTEDDEEEESIEENSSDEEEPTEESLTEDKEENEKNKWVHYSSKEIMFRDTFISWKPSGEIYKELTTKQREGAKELLRELYNIQTTTHTINKDIITKGKEEIEGNKGNKINHKQIKYLRKG